VTLDWLGKATAAEQIVTSIESARKAGTIQRGRDGCPMNGTRGVAEAAVSMREL